MKGLGPHWLGEINLPGRWITDFVAALRGWSVMVGAERGDRGDLAQNDARLYLVGTRGATRRCERHHMPVDIKGQALGVTI